MESSSAATIATEEGYQPVFFDPRPLKNLLPVDEMESLSPIMDMKASPVCRHCPLGQLLLQFLPISTSVCAACFPLTAS